EAGLDETGRHGVDVDVELTELGGERPGEADQAHLGGGVVRLARVALQSRRRRGERDLAMVRRGARSLGLALGGRPHVVDGGAGGVVGGPQVDVEDEVPYVLVPRVE